MAKGKEYQFVGPEHLRKYGADTSQRHAVTGSAPLLTWMEGCIEKLRKGQYVILTYIVSWDGQLYVADRRSEHVACAGGLPVLSAGEMTFVFDGRHLEVTEVTNLSTGYCPEPSSWPMVHAAIRKAGFEPPDGFAVEFEFRKCPNCGTTTVIKDEVYECAVCGAELPTRWNYA